MRLRCKLAGSLSTTLSAICLFIMMHVAHLDRFAEAHVISEDAVEAQVVQTQQPAQAMHLVLVQVHARQARRLLSQLSGNVARKRVPCTGALLQRIRAFAFPTCTKRALRLADPQCGVQI